MSKERQLFRCVRNGQYVKLSTPSTSPLDFISRWARVKPSAPALIGQIRGLEKSIVRTWSQLLKNCCTIGKELCKSRVERIGIVCGSHVSTIETVLSSVLSCNEFVIVDLLQKPFDLQLFKLMDSKASVLVIPSLEEMPDLLIDKINFIRGEHPELKIWSVGANRLAEKNLLAGKLRKCCVEGFDFSVTNWEKPLGLFYSPGKHTKPRGYIYQSSAIYANTQAVAERFRFDEKTKLHLGMHLENCDGLIPVLSAIYAGGTAVVSSQIDVENFWSAMRKSEANVARVKSGLLKKLLRDKQRTPESTRTHLKYIISGSGYLPRHIGMKFYELFDIPLLQCYGTAETGGYVLAMESGRCKREYEIALRDNLVGNELKYCNVKLSNSESIDSEHGIIYVRGYTVSCGYWDGREIRHWKEHWLRTPDLARLSPEQKGSYQIRGRVEDALILGNDEDTVWPFFIEQSLLATFNFLSDCIATTVVDGKGNSNLSAVVIMPDDIPKHRKSELIALMHARLSAGGVAGLSEKLTPGELIVLEEDQLPRLHDGQPDREKLQHQIVTQSAKQGLTAS